MPTGYSLVHHTIVKRVKERRGGSGQPSCHPPADFGAKMFTLGSPWFVVVVVVVVVANGQWQWQYNHMEAAGVKKGCRRRRKVGNDNRQRVGVAML